MAYNKLTKDQVERRDDMAAELRAKWEDVESASQAIQGYMDELNAAIVAYNETVGDVEQFRGDIAGQMQEAFDEKSEKWQEGETGQAYDGWKSEWDNFEAEEMAEVEIDIPGEPSTADDLEGLPESPE